MYALYLRPNILGCIFVCMSPYGLEGTSVCMYVCMSEPICTRMYVCMPESIYTGMYVCMPEPICIRIYVCEHVMYIYMSEPICTRMYVYTLSIYMDWIEIYLPLVEVGMYSSLDEVEMYLVPYRKNI